MIPTSTWQSQLKQNPLNHSSLSPVPNLNHQWCLTWSVNIQKPFLNTMIHDLTDDFRSWNRDPSLSHFCVTNNPSPKQAEWFQFQYHFNFTFWGSPKVWNCPYAWWMVEQKSLVLGSKTTLNRQKPTSPGWNSIVNLRFALCHPLEGLGAGIFH